MRQKSKQNSLGATALLILGLFCALLLVFFLDGARWLAPKERAAVRAEFLLEEMDRAAAEALLTEPELSPQGGARCRVIEIGALEPQRRQYETKDGRILLLPSQNRFCTHVVLRIEGNFGEDGFLAFGSLPLHPGMRLSLVGAHMTGDGLLLSLSPLLQENAT